MKGDLEKVKELVRDGKSGDRAIFCPPPIDCAVAIVGIGHQLLAQSKQSEQSFLN